MNNYFMLFLVNDASHLSFKSTVFFCYSKLKTIKYKFVYKYVFKIIYQSKELK